MDLDQRAVGPAPARVGAVVDEEQAAAGVVALQLRPLAGLERVLERQPMKAETLAEGRHRLLVRALEVEPEELVPRRQAVDRRRVVLAEDLHRRRL